MVTDEIKDQFKNLHMEPIVHVGEDLIHAIKQRSKRLQGITIEKPTPMPPLEWIVLIVAGVCVFFAYRENKTV
jgi:hypothetical protein